MMDINQFFAGNWCSYHGNDFKIEKIVGKYAFISRRDPYVSSLKPIQVMLSSLEGVKLRYKSIYTHIIEYSHMEEQWQEFRNESNMIRFRYKYAKRKWIDIDYNFDAHKFVLPDGRVIYYVHQLENHIIKTIKEIK